MTEIELQQQNIKQLLELVQANPELRILPFVDTEVVCSDDHSSWVAGWGKASIDEIWINHSKERIYIKSDAYDGLVEDLADDLLNEKEDLTEEEAVLKAHKIVDSYDWEKVIAVRIELPY